MKRGGKGGKKGGSKTLMTLKLGGDFDWAHLRIYDTGENKFYNYKKLWTLSKTNLFSFYYFIYFK